MSVLSALIKKREIREVATATFAIPATQAGGEGGTVAKIARIAVASPQKTDAGDAAQAIASRWWRLRLAGGGTLEVACNPPATRDDIQERYPDALAAEPFVPTVRQPSAPLTAGEESAIREWLAVIGEDDQETVSAVIDQCQRDEGARRFFVERAMANLPKPGTDSVGFDSEWFEERAGILEFDAGFSRDEAERLAYLEVTSKWMH